MEVYISAESKRYRCRVDRRCLRPRVDNLHRLDSSRFMAMFTRRIAPSLPRYAGCHNRDMHVRLDPAGHAPLSIEVYKHDTIRVQAA